VQMVYFGRYVGYHVVEEIRVCGILGKFVTDYNKSDFDIQL